METFPCYWPFVRGIHRSKASDTEPLKFSLICTSTNGWVNNQDAGDLRRYRAHYGVSVMVAPRLFGSTFVQVMACRLFGAKLTWTSADLLSIRPLARCLCDPESSGTIGTLLAHADSTGTIKRVCWHKPPKWRPLKTCRALNSQNRNVSVSTGSN